MASSDEPEVEHERKFLVNDISFLGRDAEGTGIVQGYFPSNNGCTVRVRLVPAQELFELTFKGPRQGISRREFDIPLLRRQAEDLLVACHGTVEKTRYPFLAGDGHLWTIDVFHGQCAGLVLAEIEFQSPAEPFETPPWAIQEVTDDARYYNDYLAAVPYQDWPL